MDTTSAAPEVLSRRAEAPAEPRPRPPVEWWALIGALFVAFWAYVLIKWVTGPRFEQVPSGPSEPPTWMEVIFVTWQVAAVPVVGTLLYFFVVRPWRRRREVPTDGLLLIAFILMSLQDQASNFFGIWYVVNSDLWNMGSFYNEIPGWLAFGEPGAQVPFAPLFHLLEYPVGMFVGVWLAAWVMDRAKKRWGMGPAKLIALIFPVMALWDLVIEGFIYSLAGFYSMPGGHMSIFPETYHKFPFIEAFFVAMLLTPIAALRYFKNDRGETLVERGVAKLRVSNRRKVGLRLLALIGATQLVYLVCYNIPVAGYMGAKPGTWPSQVQEQSYFTDRLCGEGTERLCPAPGIPMTQKARVNTNEEQLETRLIRPLNELSTEGAGAAARRLEVVPLDPDPPVPFTGRLLGERSR